MRFSAFFVLIALGALPASAQQAAPTPGAADGGAVYDRACAGCHATSGSGAPTREALRVLTPEAILNALVNGRMQVQGSTLSDAERRAVAVFLAARPFGAAPATVGTVATCKASTPMSDPSRGPSWNGWGNGVANTRYAKDGGLTAADLPKLTLKWAFGYAGVNAARAQPTLAGGRLFVASENSEVHALDPKTGCTHWTYKAAGGVSTALAAGPY